MFTQRIPGFLKINESGVLIYFGFNGKKGEHYAFAGAVMPEKHFARKFDQIREIRGRLVCSNLQEESVYLGYIEDKFDLFGDDNLNCIYQTTYGYIRIIESGARFLCENWNKIPFPQVYRGDGISAINREVIYLYCGSEIVKAFSNLGNGIFHNHLSLARFRNPQKTLAENIHIEVVH